MLPVSGDHASFASHHGYGREVWVCDSDLQPVERVPVLAQSSLQVTAGLVRRTGTLQIANEAARWLPNEAGPLWWDRPFLVRFGATVASVTSTVDMPLLWPDRPSYDPTSRTVTVGVQDALRILAEDAQLSRPVILQEGQGLGELVRRLLVLAGAPDDDAFHDHDDGGAVVPAGGAVYEVGQRIAAILQQVLVDNTLQLFAAPPAVYTTRRVPDETVAPVATLARGREVRLLGYRVGWQNRARNHVIVEGVSMDDEPFRVEVFDLDPSSPVMFGKPGVGDLSFTYPSDGITTEDQAYSVGRSLLVARAVEEELELDIPTLPALDRYDAIVVDEFETGIVGRFVVDSFPLPLAPGAQTITVRRERVLS